MHRRIDEPKSEDGLSRRQLIAGGVALGGLGALAGRAPGGEATPAPEPEPLADRVSDLEPPGAADFGRRVERAQRLLQDSGADALMIEATTSLGYFTGLKWWPSERLFAAVIPRRGEPAFVCPAFEEGRAREKLGSDTELRVWQEHESPYAITKGLLADLGLATAAVALDPQARYFVAHGLAVEIGAGRVVDGSPVVNACRGHKDAAEIALMRRANEITQRAIAHAVAGLREGTTQAELAAAVAAAHRAQGAEPSFALVLFGANAAYPHGTAADEGVRPGDVVLMDCGASVHGYQSDITRTFVFGARPTDRQRQIWDTVRKAQRAGFDAVRPGATCGSVDAAARRVIEAAGFGGGYEVFTHRLGHGIGLQGHEWPYLVKDSDVVLAPGQTFSDEPGIYIVGEIGVRLEDILHVTPDGCELLSEPVDELPVVGM